VSKRSHCRKPEHDHKHIKGKNYKLIVGSLGSMFGDNVVGDDEKREYATGNSKSFRLIPLV